MQRIMIDFRNVKRRIKKHTVEEGEFFLRDISTAEGKKIADDAGEDPEKLLAAFLQALMCDEKGELLNYSIDDLTNFGSMLLQDVMAAVMVIIHGEKKLTAEQKIWHKIAYDNSQLGKGQRAIKLEKFIIDYEKALPSREELDLKLRTILGGLAKKGK